MKGALWHLPVLATGYPACVNKQGCFASLTLALSLARDKKEGGGSSHFVFLPVGTDCLAWRWFAPEVRDHLSVGYPPWRSSVGWQAPQGVGLASYKLARSAWSSRG